MARVKICPSCKHENSISKTRCENCRYDLTRIPVSISGLQESSAHTFDSATPIAETQRPTPPPSVGRRCSCGNVAPLQTMTCPVCGASLSAAPITPYTHNTSGTSQRTPEPSPPGVWRIASTDRIAVLDIRDEQTLMIGWAGELGSYFESNNKEYVSNRHCILSVMNGKLFIEDNNSTNGTIINNRRIPAKIAQPLMAGDIFCLGGLPDHILQGSAYFLVEKRENDG